MDKTTITKLASPSCVLAHQGQKIKGQGHMVTKCNKLLKAIEWPLAGVSYAQLLVDLTVISVHIRRK